MQSASNKLVSFASTGTLFPEDVIKSIDNVVGNVENLKRQVSGIICCLRNLDEVLRTTQLLIRYAQNGEMPRRMLCVNACTIGPFGRCQISTECKPARILEVGQ